MELEVVIEQGEKLNNAFIAVVKNFMVAPLLDKLFVLVVFFVLFAIIFIAVFSDIKNYIKKKEKDFTTSITYVVLMLLILGIMCFAILLADPVVNQEVIEEWETEYVLPYSETLQTEKYPLTYFLPLEKNEHRKLINEEKNPHAVPSQIIYTNEKGKGIQEFVDATILLRLEDGETPYIETKVIPEDLGHGIRKGMLVDTKIYLPKNYDKLIELENKEEKKD